jgi:hypothetical protein
MHVAKPIRKIMAPWTFRTEDELERLLPAAYYPTWSVKSVFQEDDADATPKRRRGRPSTIKHGTRKANEYNKFMSSEMKKRRKQLPDMCGRELFKLCAKAWKERNEQ